MKNMHASNTRKKCKYCSHALNLSSRVLRSRSVLRCYFIPCNILNSLTKTTYILHLRNLEHRTCKSYNYININIYKYIYNLNCNY